MRREFPARVKEAAYTRADGHCDGCGGLLWPNQFHYDHLIPDALGGEPTLANCWVLCKACHSTKTTERDIPRIAKTKRVRAKSIGIRKKSSMPGSRDTKWKKTIDGRTVPR